MCIRDRIQGASIVSLRKAFPSFEELKQDVIDASIETAAFTGELPVNEEQFRETIANVKEKLGLLTLELARLLSSIVSEAALAQQKLNSIKSYKEVSEDITAQLSDLFPPHFPVSYTHLDVYKRQALISRIDRQRSHFPEFFLRELIKRGTPVDHTVVFKNREVRDVAFKFFAWAFDQRSVRLKRLQQFDQTRDVVRGCLTQGLQIFHGHHGSHAVMRKELSQKSSVHCVGHDVNAFNACLLYTSRCV